MSHRSIRVLPFAVSTIFTAILSAQTSVQEVTYVSGHAFLGGKVTAYGGFVWPYMKGSLKIETNFLTNPAIEAVASMNWPTEGAHGLLPSCQTRIRMNGTTRDSAVRHVFTAGAGQFTASLVSLAVATNVLAGAGAQRTLTFGATQISLATNYTASGVCSANFAVGKSYGISMHEMDEGVMEVSAQGATTVQWSTGTSGAVGIVSQLNYGTHWARVDNAYNSSLSSGGVLWFAFGAASLLEVIYVPGAPVSVDKSFAARSGVREWYKAYDS